MLCWCCLPILAQLLIFFQNHFTNSSVRLFIYKISTHCFLKAAFLCFFFSPVHWIFHNSIFKFTEICISVFMCYSLSYHSLPPYLVRLISYHYGRSVGGSQVVEQMPGSTITKTYWQIRIVVVYLGHCMFTRGPKTIFNLHSWFLNQDGDLIVSLRLSKLH